MVATGMRFTSNMWIKLFLGMNVCTAIAVGSTVIYSRINSDNAITQRAKGLEILAQHVKADTCWKVRSQTPWKLNDLIDLPGSTNKLPSSCVYSPQTQQFLKVSYLNGALQIEQVYSRQELRNQLSRKEESNVIKR